jgi:hypothetical protein
VTRARILQHLSQTIWLLFFATLAIVATPATAQNGDPVEVEARVEVIGIQSDIMIEDGDEFDSSGYGIRGDLALDWSLSPRTTARIEVDAGVFDYEGLNRDTLTSYGVSASVEHEVSETVTVRLRARRIENIAVLEAFSADQTSIAARVEWSKGNDRVRVEAEYRQREYDTTRAGTGEGYRAAAQYNRRFGSYHWLRFDARVEKMTSEDEERRSYDRRVLRVKYSQPVTPMLRVRPSIEYREWDYAGRIARGDPDRSLREDSYAAPAVDLSYGHWNRGPYARASAEYRFRYSNDSRYDMDGARFGLVVGYRF